METKNVISELRRALKLANDEEDTNKLEGLGIIDGILFKDDRQLVDMGYKQVIFKELTKLVKFNSGPSFSKTLDILSKYYFNKGDLQDDLMQVLIYRYGLSTDSEVSLECLKNIFILIDKMGDNVAKHSKQLLQLADLSCPIDAKPVLINILDKLKLKLPQRKQLT